MVAKPSDPRGHLPVLVSEVVSLLVNDPTGAYLDLTAGGGGHLKALADRLDDTARLFGLDRDPEAVARTTKVLSGRKQFRSIIHSPFGDIAEVAHDLPEQQFSGILLDLGISSYQLDSPDRGFSFRHDSPLDMRFDPSVGTSAGDLINQLDEKELARLIRDLGEEKQAARIAKAIVRERQDKVIATTGQLKEIILSVVRPPHQNKSLARVFQALRMKVNRELDQLSAVLPAAFSLLKKSGRLAVIAYHSLEDRQVKRFFQDEARGRCSCPPGLPECLCGSRPTAVILTSRPIAPQAEEIAANPRSRSARLRVAEKLT